LVMRVLSRLSIELDKAAAAVRILYR
jgi:hypothetical protein